MFKCDFNIKLVIMINLKMRLYGRRRAKDRGRNFLKNYKIEKGLVKDTVKVTKTKI